MSGTPMQRIGTPMETMKASLRRETRAMVARVRPTKRLPESPKKTEAGL